MPTPGSVTGAKGNTASDTGVSADTIKIGFITSVTGNAASSFADSAAGAQARVAVENSKGGVNGRKIQLIVADDASSPTQDLTASQSLVSQGVFGIINFSPYAFGGYRALQPAGIPVTGGGFDGPEWGQQPNTNMFSWTGGITPNHQGATSYTTYGQFLKSLGVTSVAGFAYGASPSSTASIKDLKTSVEQAGLKMGYENLSVPFGSVDFTSYALAMKQAGVAADLMIRGLDVAGQNPTRKSFIDNLTKVTNYDAGGVLANPVGFNHFGSFQPSACIYFVQVKANDFVTVNGGKPVCGTLLPGL